MKQFSRIVRSVVLGTFTFGGAAGMVGCTNTAPAKTTAAAGIRGDVTDIRPVEPAAYQPPLYDTSAVIPLAPQPVTPEAPPVSTFVPAALDSTAMSTTPALGGNTHVVRHGETLFSIAKITYGNGKAWRKIAAANPGASASKLRVGQKLLLP